MACDAVREECDGLVILRRPLQSIVDVAKIGIVVFADAAAAEDLALAFNAVYRLFGGVDTEHCLVFRHGNEPTWYEWMAMKTAWCRDKDYIRAVKDKIRDFPQTDNGYLWSWGTSPYWPTGDGALHYDGLFRYVAAVAEFLRWSGDTAFLDETDRTTCGTDKAVDASEGRTVYEKCRKAMQYALHELNGKDGVITITEKSAFLADGVTRFDIGENGDYVWNNTGRAGAHAVQLLGQPSLRTQGRL